MNGSEEMYVRHEPDGSRWVRLEAHRKLVAQLVGGCNVTCSTMIFRITAPVHDDEMRRLKGKLTEQTGCNVLLLGDGIEYVGRVCGQCPQRGCDDCPRKAK